MAAATVETMERVLDEYVHWPKAPKDLTTRLDVLQHRRQRCLPMEQAVRERLTAEIAALSAERALLDAHEKVRLPVMSLEPLAWTQPKQVGHGFASTVLVPKFALLPVHLPHVKIHGDKGGSWFTPTSQWPSLVRSAFATCGSSLMRRAETRSRDNSITYEYKAALPEEARETIAEAALAQRFQGIYLFAETIPDQWKFTEGPRTPRDWSWAHLDPLVLGWAHDALWVLGKFDPTPLESYVNTEFALPPAETVKQLMPPQ